MQREREDGKLGIYLRKIRLPEKEPAGGDTMIWIWMGRNPFGEDWNLGSVRLLALDDVMRQYARKIRRSPAHGAPLAKWRARRSE